MKKILSFIVYKNKFLLLRGNENDPQFKESFWYVVTGSKDNIDKTLIDTVKREVKEETNLKVIDLKYLNLIFKYKSLGNLCEEYCYVSYVDTFDVVLNEESVDYCWCSKDEFLNKIKLYIKKEEMNSILDSILNNKIPYEKETIYYIGEESENRSDVNFYSNRSYHNEMHTMIKNIEGKVE